MRLHWFCSASNQSAPYDLSIPLIAGFTVTVQDQPNQPLPQLEMFANAIFAMMHLARFPWEATMGFSDYEMSGPEDTSVLRARSLPIGRYPRWKAKHLILGIHQMGLYLGTRERYQKTNALLAQDRHVIGAVGLQRKTSVAQTVTTIPVNQTTVLQLSYNTTTVADSPGMFVDPSDFNFVIHYSMHGGDRIYINDLFTTFIDAMANGAPHEPGELGAQIDSVSITHQSRLLIRDAGGTTHPKLSWERGLQAVGELWRGLVHLHQALRAMTFEIKYASETIGFGSMRAITPPVGNSTSIVKRTVGWVVASDSE